MKATILAAAIAAGLVGCSSPPKAVVPDGSSRKPVNSEARVSEYRAQNAQEQAATAQRALLERQLAMLQSELAGLKAYVVQLSAVAEHNASLAPRRAEQRAKALSQAGQRQPMSLSADRSAPVLTGDNESFEVGGSSVVFRVTQPFAKAEFNPSPAFEKELLRLAHLSQRIEIRGRTDSWTDNAADRSIAQSRAVRAREFLIANGIDAGKIRTTFLARGGYLADNATPAGRALNRRVEIETNGVDTSPFVDQVATANASLQ
jgi:outer membrane protein OmpA-like peptidoglycan-associated protein